MRAYRIAIGLALGLGLGLASPVLAQQVAPPLTIVAAENFYGDVAQ